MKNRNQTNRPTRNRRFTTTTRPTREAHRLTPKAPHHDLLVLCYYPGMRPEHSTAA